MASKTSYISLVILVTLMFYDRATAQSGCTNALVGLSPCLNYVSGNSSTPSSSCCVQLKGVVQSQAWCLCALLKSQSSSYLGIVINQTLALQLPGACKVQTPPTSQCDASNNGPSSAATPASPPSSGDEIPQGPTSTVEPDIPSETGSKTVSRNDGSSNGGSNIRQVFGYVGTLLLSLSCAYSAAGF
ncbi:Bifunctional inhibitor/lipid-transfer protein/seed storage 2S albumin superfamily protein [Dorcoceras hygrometricum]|uniref:Bifunctional inhibitor/lipid-transfer protein/seed storage 2S albumin superfamily protein n=1 Tax=Dorcoceras hygrometricum TaxID=472368 RepID=A0A2Z7AWZ8_9LAMI|nr:Bifunctional inhibitor/lipid-transfer protein/seed storage 2S albumin superfamily protein [Dorcoceras hygrometricum]